MGTGSISKLLNDRELFVFFASGAGDSSNVTEQDVIRESLLLGRWLRYAVDNDHMFVYFSSIAVFMNDTQYTRHKLQMENVIRNLVENYTIIHLGNIWECTNPNTFINAIKAKQAKGEPVEIRNEYKYMISKDQLNFVTDNLPRTGKHEISIFGEMLTVAECLKR